MRSARLLLVACLTRCTGVGGGAGVGAGVDVAVAVGGGCRYEVPEKVLAKDTETTPAQEITRLLQEDYRMAKKFGMASGSDSLPTTCVAPLPPPLLPPPLCHPTRALLQRCKGCVSHRLTDEVWVWP